MTLLYAWVVVAHLHLGTQDVLIVTENTKVFETKSGCELYLSAVHSISGDLETSCQMFEVIN